MIFNFKDKVVLITGSGSGLGQHLAVAFAQAGAKVAITARNLDRVKETASKLEKIDSKFIKLKLDVTSYKDCENAINETTRKFGKIDYLINNASGYLIGWDLRKFSVEDIEKEINTTFRSVVFMTKAILNQFLKSKHGTIVNVSSGAGLMNSESNSTIYAADKSAVIRFSERMHKNLSPNGIRVCCVVPCAIRDKALEKEAAVSLDDVAQAIMIQCLDKDNLAIQTMILEPKKTKK